MSRTKVAVFFGGQSGEHDISCLSAATVVSWLDREKYDLILVGITREGEWLLANSPQAVLNGTWEQSKRRAVLLPDATLKSLLVTETDGSAHLEPVDLAFPVLHGRGGEDGSIQGLFQLAGIPYVGCGVAASAVCMDKLYTKILVASTRVAQAKYVGLEKSELERPTSAITKIERALRYPIFVKPSDGGSSQGVTCVKSRDTLIDALNLAAQYGTRVIAEEQIVGREIECAVLSTPQGAAASGVGEILSADSFYTFDAKYSNPQSRTDTHPKFSPGKEEEIRAAAVRIFNTVGGHGMARVDFFLENGSNRVVFNEINTIPGFTSISMYPMLWEEAGMPLNELLDNLIAEAYTREF